MAQANGFQHVEIKMPDAWGHLHGLSIQSFIPYEWPPLPG